MNLPEEDGFVSLEAYCENLIFRNEENGYTVAVFSKSEPAADSKTPESGSSPRSAAQISDVPGKLRTPAADSFTAVGCMPFLEPGDFLLLAGKWVVHGTYGRQLQVESYTQVTPHTPEAILKLLSSGSIHGVGPKLGERIVGAFGENAIRIMREEPEKLARVRGITLKKAREIASQMVEKGDFQELSLMLAPFGIGTARIMSIHKRFGSAALYIVKNNPYRLADEVSGIGFRTADVLARHFGCDPASPFRAASAIMFCMTQAENEGHTYLPLSDLLVRAEVLLSARQPSGADTDKGPAAVDDGPAASPQDTEGFLPGEPGPGEQSDDPSQKDAEARREGYRQLVSSRKLVACRVEDSGTFSLAGAEDMRGDIRVSFPKTIEAEISSAKMIAQLVKRGNVSDDAEDVEKKMARSAGQMGIELAPEQRSAVLYAANSYVSIITGGPGTGKTTIIRVLTDFFKANGRKVVLCAPTGRAAKRMAEASGVTARTIHRLLEMEKGGEDAASVVFKRNEENPIEADTVIVDETSMLDTFLFYSLLRAVGNRTQLVFVGDSDQLPSVGAGNVLSDMIHSGAIHVERLTQIFRQAQLSRIVLNAHRVLSGEPIQFSQALESDCMLVAMDSAARIAEAVMKLCSHVLPDVYGIDVLRDAAVLCPSRKGPAGVAALNPMLQEAIGHTGEPHMDAHGFSFRLHDKVMQTRNNYDLTYRNPDGTHGSGVFNGELGFVREIDLPADTLTIEMDDGRIVSYEKSQLDDLDPAYAVTVHKSQGSEYPVVVLAVPPGPPMLNNRNLLYTAITRAKRRLFIVASKNTLDRMIRNDSQAKRMTSLDEFLKIYAEGGS